MDPACLASNSNLSKTKSSKTYRDSLPADVIKRYDEKISVIGIDPYCAELSEFDKDKTNWPEISIVDVMHYLVFQESAYTREELRNYKSMEAYKLFQDGWVREILHKKINDHHLLRAKVTHSMAVREKLLDAWVITDSQGIVNCAHCTCMAGLGECCSHVAAILFALETWGRIRKEASVTDTPAYWMFPSAAKFDKPYKRVREMDFVSADKKRKTSGQENTHKDLKEFKKCNIPSPTKREEKEFFSSFSRVMPDAAILSLIDECNDGFVPKALSGDWPINFNTLKLNHKSSEKADLTWSAVKEKCSDINISVTQDQADFLELQTRGQVSSPFWQTYRRGRITASNLYAACHTNDDNPSVSLLKSICHQVKSAALEWGRKNEKRARKEYSKVRSDHQHFAFRESGLIVNVQYPEFGASPDGIVTCDCCGQGCLEIKCPYSMKDRQLLDVEWLEGKTSKDKKLSTRHQYYFQIQMQMFVTGNEYCDFFVWSPHDIFLQRIYRNETMWLNFSEKAKCFHSKCVMPELLCNFFSRQKILKAKPVSAANSSVEVLEPHLKYCVCGGEDDGRKMIMCENEKCSKKWYHMVCIKMKRVPKGQWFCTECKSAE